MKENQRVVVTKRMLKEGLIRLLERKAINEIRISELCAESGVNRATFYRHYQSAEDVLLEIEQELSRQLFPLIPAPQNTQEAMLQIEKNCRYLYRQADTLRLLFRCNTSKNMMERINCFYQQFLALCEKENPDIKIDEATARVLIALLGGGCYCLIHQWIVEELPKSPEEIAAIISNVFHWPGMSRFLKQDDET